MAAGRSIAARWLALTGRMANTPGPLQPGGLGAVTFPSTRLIGLVEIAPGADLTADPSTWSWVDITQWVRHDLGISTTVGRRDQAGRVDPSRATLKVDNRDRRFSRRNPIGPYYGQLTLNTPIRMGVDPGDGMHYRYYGFVNEWPKRWDRSGNDSTITITCGGILRRLQRGQTLRSPMFRTMAGITEGDFAPVAYWPLEDGTNATRFAGTIDGNRPAEFTGAVSLASYSGAVGSDPLPTINDGGRITAYMPAYTDTDVWQVQFVLTIPRAPASDAIYFDIRTSPGPGSSIATIRIYYLSPDVVRIALLDFGGAEITSSGTTATYGQSLLWSVTQRLVGGILTTTLSEYDEDGLLSQTDLLTAGNLGRVISISGYANSVNAGWSPGHWALYTDPAVLTGGSIGPNAAALGGHAGEMAHERITRLCREEGIALHCVAGESAMLGPQPSGTILAVLRDAETADLGVLYEHEFGLGYRALSEYCNQPTGLPLDFDQRHVADPPEPADDDLRFRNRWTVTRTDGSSATVLSPDYDATQGLYDGSATVNVKTDEQLPDIAGWLVHRDTVDEDYWTGLKLRFHGTPDLIPGWTSLPYGSRITIANPPSQADPGTIDAIVEGWSERWDTVSWEATLNTSPASTYTVAEWDEFLWDSGSSSLTSDITSGATSISVTTTDSNDLWVTGTVNFDIGIAGERMTVTNISSTTSPQTFTVTRSVNGVVKPHSAAAQVSLWEPPIWAL